MAFVDELKLHVKAGRGGNGVVRWRHEKHKEFSGPSGGDGGKGGNIYIEAVRDVGILAKYRNIKVFKAGNGQAGMRDSRHGKNGEDVVIELPIGSIVTDIETGKQYSFLKEGEKICIAEGGRGGLGNEYFKSSTNRSPEEQTDGKPGEEKDIEIELQLIADVGLIGLPNAGKTSLLNALTRAEAKVGSYMFTTLEPNLGELYGYILADIPGLIEGASEGKGLGHTFLRHVERTKLLCHCISLENEDVEAAYRTVRSELEAHDEALSKKVEIILLTKTDLATPEKLKGARNSLKKYNSRIHEITILDDDKVKTFSDELIKILRSL